METVFRVASETFEFDGRPGELESLVVARRNTQRMPGLPDTCVIDVIFDLKNPWRLHMGMIALHEPYHVCVWRLNQALLM